MNVCRSHCVPSQTKRRPRRHTCELIQDELGGLPSSLRHKPSDLAEGIETGVEGGDELDVMTGHDCDV